MLKKCIVYCLWFIVFSLSTIHYLPSTIYAADEFSTSYDVTYDVDTDGITQVSEKINLKNLTNEYYANQFKLIIGATQVFDVKASDGSGNMQVDSVQKDNSTEITVKFNQQLVGLNKILPWTLSFKSKDFAERIGKVWEVRTPKVSSVGNIENYNLTISVPLEFGEPTSISPIPKSQTSNSGKIFLAFNKDQLSQSGVSASFGNFQLFDFDLGYHLDNNNLFPVLTNIALPPDTAYQDVIYKNITPVPLNVTVDEDGNYLAWYRLNKGEKLDIKLLGSAKLYTASKVKKPFLETSLRKKYTQADKYWEKDHPKIQIKLAEILSSNLPAGRQVPPADSLQKAKLIYRYVVDFLKYDSSRLNNKLERFGAVTALNNNELAVCMEFTDLFITLARAADIPARELDGYAYTANPKLRPLSLNKDVLHAWPEFWDDKKGWVMIDPTWENTTGGVDYFNKLDLSHFVFVTKGSSSEQPAPAGSYKYVGQDSQDVKVSLSENDFLGNPKLDVKIENPEPILAGFPTKLKIKISNMGNAVYPSNQFLINSQKLTFLETQQQNLGPIPPYGQASFDFNIRTKGLFDSFDDNITILIGSQKFEKKVSVKPFLIFQTYPLIGTGIVSLMAVIYLTILGTHIYKHSLRSDDLRARRK